MMKTPKISFPLFVLLMLIQVQINGLENRNASAGNIQSDTLQKPIYDAESSPVHQWIAFQAYLKLPGSNLKNELADYLPTNPTSPYYSRHFDIPSGWGSDQDAPYVDSSALIEGVWEEDRGDVVISILGYDLYDRYFHHFWNPAGEYDDALVWIYDWPRSALEVSQDYFQNAVEQYNAGNLAMAYYWIGRTAHLLTDLSVPAHVQLDSHPCPLGDCDNYEDFTAALESRYKHVTSSSPESTVPSPPYTEYPRYTPGWYNQSLTNLFYSLASFTDGFDSDDVNGTSSEFGNGRYRTASNAFAPDMSIDSIWVLGPSQQRIDKLSSPQDYSIVKCLWSNHASIVYTQAGLDKIKVQFSNGVRVYYSDGSHEDFQSMDESNVPLAVCGEIYQPQLQARAIGHTAALYQLFWNTCHSSSDDNYEENDDMTVSYDLSAYWATWLHNVFGLGINSDQDWYKISVPDGLECLYLECRFENSKGNIDMDLFDPSGSPVASSVSSDKDIERICYSSPEPGTYYIKVYQQSYQGNTYDLWWGDNCTDKITLSSPPDGYWFLSCDQQIVVEWNISDKVTSFELEIDDDPGFISPCHLTGEIIEQGYAEVCTRCGNLSPDQYYWRVKGQTDSPCNLWGEWSDTWSFNIGCPELTIDPDSLSPKNGSSGPRLVDFDWKELLYAEGYAFQIDTVSREFSNLWCNEVVFESQVTKTIPPVERIYWRVKPLGPGDCNDGAWTSPQVYDYDQGSDPIRHPVLFQNHPNPFNQTTEIEFTLSEPGLVSMIIYDLLGRKVRTLFSGYLTSGHKSVYWDGKNEVGEDASSGIYFYQLKAARYTSAKKLVLLK